MEFIFLWLILGGIVAAVANSRGRNAFGWFVYGFLIFPVAIIHVLVLSPNVKEQERKAVEAGERKKCPYCAEVIKREANVCRFCGRDLPEEATVSDQMDQRDLDIRK